MARRRAKTSREILSQLQAEDDGLPVRRIGVWSLEKLAILLLYFEGFTRACVRAGDTYYVDGLAGPGICRIRAAQAAPYQVWGSPLVALRTEPLFSRCIFLDINARSTATLSARVSSYGRRALVRQGDVNQVLPQILRSDVPGAAPCFCLLDPEGTELDWSTIEAAALTPGRRRKPELLVLFAMSMGFIRLLTISREIRPGWKVRLHRMFSNEGWWNVYQDRVAGRLLPAEAKARYIEIYEDGLKLLGYRHVRSHPITAPTSPRGQRRELYHLVFASDSDAGRKIMDYVFQRPYYLDFPVDLQPPLL